MVSKLSDANCSSVVSLSWSVGQVNLCMYVSKLRHGPVTRELKATTGADRRSKEGSFREWPDGWIIHEIEQPTPVDGVAKSCKMPYPRCQSTTKNQLGPDEFPRLYIAPATLWVLSASVPATLGARSGPSPADNPFWTVPHAFRHPQSVTLD